MALALRHEGKSLGLSLGLEGQKPWDLGSRLFKAHRFGYFPDDVLKVLHLDRFFSESDILPSILSFLSILPSRIGFMLIKIKAIFVAFTRLLLI